MSRCTYAAQTTYTHSKVKRHLPLRTAESSCPSDPHPIQSLTQKDAIVFAESRAGNESVRRPSRTFVDRREGVEIPTVAKASRNVTVEAEIENKAVSYSGRLQTYSYTPREIYKSSKQTAQRLSAHE